MSVAEVRARIVPIWEASLAAPGCEQVRQLALEDPSSAWLSMVNGASRLALRLVPETHWAPDCFVAANAAPLGVASPESQRLRGTWPHCSGAAIAHSIVLGYRTTDSPNCLRIAVVPSDALVIDNNWAPIALQPTGTVTVHVIDHRLIDGHTAIIAMPDWHHSTPIGFALSIPAALVTGLTYVALGVYQSVEGPMSAALRRLHDDVDRLVHQADSSHRAAPDPVLMADLRLTCSQLVTRLVDRMLGVFRSNGTRATAADGPVAQALLTLLVLGQHGMIGDRASFTVKSAIEGQKWLSMV